MSIAYSYSHCKKGFDRRAKQAMNNLEAMEVWLDHLANSMGSIKQHRYAKPAYLDNGLMPMIDQLENIEDKLKLVIKKHSEIKELKEKALKL